MCGGVVSKQGRVTHVFTTVGTYFSSIEGIGEVYGKKLVDVPMNIAGLPAVSVPCGFNAKGMPIGMQLIGNTFDEATILNAAWQFENATHDTMFRSAIMTHIIKKLRTCVEL